RSDGSAASWATVQELIAVLWPSARALQRRVQLLRHVDRLERPSLHIVVRARPLGDLEAGAELDVAAFQTRLDHSAQRLHAPGSTAEEGVAGEQEQGTVPAHRVELVDPRL